MSRLTLSRAKTLMNAAFKTAKKDILAGVASPETISRDLINSYWGLWYKLPKREQPAFREWFDRRHGKLGEEVGAEQLGLNGEHSQGGRFLPCNGSRKSRRNRYY